MPNPSLAQADKDRAVRYYQRLRRMHPDDSPWRLLKQAGELVGVGGNAVREWAIKAKAHQSRVYFTQAERRAAAECLANLSRAQPDRPAAEIAREVAYAFGVSPKALRKWVQWFGLYRREKIAANHPWHRDHRRHFHGHAGHQTDHR